MADNILDRYLEWVWLKAKLQRQDVIKVRFIVHVMLAQRLFVISHALIARSFLLTYLLTWQVRLDYHVIFVSRDRVYLDGDYREPPTHLVPPPPVVEEINDCTCIIM